MYYSRFKMGSLSSSLRIQQKGVLCLVWCPYRLHFNWSESFRIIVHKMVAKSKRSQALSIYGQRQCPIPYGYLPFKFNRSQTKLDPPPSYFDNLVPKLWKWQVFKEKRHRSVWRFSFNNWHPKLDLAILLIGESTIKKRQLIFLERLCW